MPDSCDVVVVLPRDDFSQAVRRVSLLASDRYGRSVRLSLGEGKLEMSSKTEMGEAQETLPVDYDGEEMAIGFNARYLLEWASVVGSPSVRLEFSPAKSNVDDPKRVEPGEKPGQFRPEPPGEFDYRYIVMPMHL
jgi:DNA polymerase-3 subunit beta